MKYFGAVIVAAVFMGAAALPVLAIGPAITLADEWTQDQNVQIPPSESPENDLMRVILGIKSPDGSCSVTETWATSVDDAINTAEKNCPDCVVEDITSSYSPETGPVDTGQYCSET